MWQMGGHNSVTPSKQKKRELTKKIISTFLNVTHNENMKLEFVVL